MIFLILIGMDVIIIGGAMVVMNIETNRQMKMKARIKVLKDKKMQKRFEMWSEANRIIESVKIESE